MREPNESETGYIKRRFKEATDDEGLDRVDNELRTEGYKVENIQPRKTERRQELKKEQRALVAHKGSGSLTAEEIVENLPWPMDVDGKVDHVFVAGMKYEAMNVIRGIRLAQELSKLGIDQATPIIKMAQEMRQTEGQVAKETGIAMGSEIAGRMFDFMEQRLPQKADIAMAPDPMKGLVARNMEMMFNRLLGMVGGGPPGPTPGLVDKRTQK
jgi:hypothetical protein